MFYMYKNIYSYEILALVLDQPNELQPSGEGCGHALGGGGRAQQPTRVRYCNIGFSPRHVLDHFVQAQAADDLDYFLQ